MHIKAIITPKARIQFIARTFFFILLKLIIRTTKGVTVYQTLRPLIRRKKKKTLSTR